VKDRHARKVESEGLDSMVVPFNGQQLLESGHLVAE